MPEETTTIIPGSLDDLRGRTPRELRNMLEVLDAHLRSMHQEDTGELRDLSEDETAAMTLGLQVRDAIVDRLEEHARMSAVFARRPKAVETALQNIRHGLDDPAGDVRRLSVPEARDRALRVLDDRLATAHLAPDQLDAVNLQIRRSTDVARRLVATETDEYREAWLKLVTQPHPLLSAEEQRAVQAFQEFRAMSEGTTTAGGFGIPVLIDPSIIMTAQGSGNPILQIARQVTINTNVWKGVSSAGVSWSFDAENSEVSDDSPTLAQPSVTAFTARGFIPFSIEVGQDYPDLAGELTRLLTEGYDELLIDKFTQGSGSGEPQGILTALSANTNVRVRIQTSGSAFGANDPYSVWKALPQRFRRNASWLMSVGVNNAIRQLGTANVYHAVTATLPEGWTDALFARPVYESPYMPDVTTSTSATIGYAVVGDFSNYVVARRAGMSVELIPHLVGLTSNRPIGQRGWFAYARIGGGSANDLGFRLLTNT